MKVLKQKFTAGHCRILITAAAMYFILIWCEGLLRLACASSFFGVGLVYIFAMSLPLALLVTLGCICCSEKTNRWLCTCAAVIIIVLYASQLIYYTVFGTWYTIYSMLHGGQVAEFYELILTTIGQRLPWVFAMAAPAIGFLYYIHRTGFSVPRAGWRGRVVLVCSCVVLQCFCGFGLLPFTGKGPLDPYQLVWNVDSLPHSVEKLGLAYSMELSAWRLLFGFTPASDSTLTTSAVVQEDISESALAEAAPEQSIIREPNVLPIDWDALQASETNKAVLELADWVCRREPTYTNEMTGLFAGKNLIFITAEGFSPLAVDETLTPTLYKLMHEGFYFSNFYTPVWGVSTSDGEYVACTGLIPKSGVWSMYQSGANAMPFCLGNQFTALGYDTYAYHNHTYNYYGRDVSHPNMGYTYKGYGNGLDVEWQWPESDLEMMQLTAPEYLAQETPFHVYYMTVSGHLAYNFSGNAMSRKNREAVSHLDYSEAVQAYLACQIELDLALENLLQQLDDAGQLENTVIALSADHYPYGLTHEQINELAGHRVETEFELYKNAFILYNAGTTDGRSVTKTASSLDILPTLSNLFGIAYDSRLLMGSDIFSDASPLVMFVTRSWIGETGRYNASTGELTLRTNATQEHAQEIHADVASRFKYSQMILEQNFYQTALQYCKDTNEKENEPAANS